MKNILISLILPHRVSFFCRKNKIVASYALIHVEVRSQIYLTDNENWKLKVNSLKLTHLSLRRLFHSFHLFLRLIFTQLRHFSTAIVLGVCLTLNYIFSFEIGKEKFFYCCSFCLFCIVSIKQIVDVQLSAFLMTKLRNRDKGKI